MVSKKVTDLIALTAGQVDRATDVIEISDVSASQSKKVTPNALMNISGNAVGDTDSQTLTNKTLTAPSINGATLSGTLSGTYTIGGTPTFPSSVATLTGSQTLTNKTLTSPTINTATIVNPTITADSIAGFSVSTTGTIFGVPVTAGVIQTANTVDGAALKAGTVNTAAITTGIQLPDKMKNPYKFSVYRSAAYTTVNSVATRMPFDTKDFDTGSNVDITTNVGRFTATVAGFYQFNAVIEVTSNVSRLFIAIYKNGSDLIRGTDTNPGTGGTLGSAASAFLQLAATDFIEVFYFCGAAQAVDVTVRHSSFSGFIVSAT